MNIKLPIFLTDWIIKKIENKVGTDISTCDFKINENYLYRWYVIPRNKIFNMYYHVMKGDDDDRALHDHPWFNVSIILEGAYYEHTPKGVFLRTKGNLKFRTPWSLHRLQMADPEGCKTLFMTGPYMRKWGFQTENGWKTHEEYNAIYGRKTSDNNISF